MLQPASSDLTVVYYTASKERPEFEARILGQLVNATSGLPIITVSQSPLDVGYNICVGQIGHCVESLVHQVITGLEAATTRAVILAESDCLIGPEFAAVQYKPGFWLYPSESYITWYGSDTFFPKRLRELVGVVDREHALQIMKTIQRDRPAHISKAVMGLTRRTHFDTSAHPVITIKTDRQLHSRHPCCRNPVSEIAYWGKAAELWGRFQ